MADFVSIGVREPNGKHYVEIYPRFAVSGYDDIMFRGGAFYAVWDEEKGLWSTDHGKVVELIDRTLYEEGAKVSTSKEKRYMIMDDYSTGSWSMWKRYCKESIDNYHELDGTVVFSNTPPLKENYASHSLPYPLSECETPSFDYICNMLYDPIEVDKIMWLIGSVISGYSKKMQKFFVFYGPPGSGKSTILNIISGMFEGYCQPFDSKALGVSSNMFALEDLKSNPLIAIDHDGDMSRLDDNTRINSIVSHETMLVNEKFKSKYPMKFRSMLIVGTNKPVAITDAKSGLIRRLIDILPSGRIIERNRYEELIELVKYEYSGIAYKCLQKFKELGEHYYDAYKPILMMGATNQFYNFVEDNYYFFSEENPDGISLNTIWKRYLEYVNENGIIKPYQKMNVKTELRSYFEECLPRFRNERYWYRGFKKEIFDYKTLEDMLGLTKTVKKIPEWLIFEEQESIFDSALATCPAQYVNKEGTPSTTWDRCETKLSDLDTTKLHYVLPPGNLIMIDFDLRDEEGDKSYDENVKEACKWPPTYGELSKSGGGIHLYYYYDGDVDELARVYAPNIEVKVPTGKSSIRRMLTKCNNLPIVPIKSGLPLRGAKKVISEDIFINEKALRTTIKKNLNKEIHANTTQSINFIYKILEDAYNSGVKYDVSDLRQKIMIFAMKSTNQSDHCIKTVSKMKFKSEEPSDNTESRDFQELPMIFYDVEVFPNLFVVVYKKAGPDSECVKLVNPTPGEIEELCKSGRLVGFNNRKYDNHILYARMMGYTNEQLFGLSKRIINSKERDVFFAEAYNLSYTDIYDFMSSTNKASLKKWEIKLGIHHLELGLPWDQPVDESMWETVADYCINDVLATEAVWNCDEVQADWRARQILADISGLTVNDTTNQCTTRFIVGTDRNPQRQYVYTDLSTIFPGYEYSPYGIEKTRYNEGAKIVSGKSIYRGEDPGEGGYVYAEPGMYAMVALLDVASMHPHSLMKLNMFGDAYTKRFAEIVNMRILIKRGQYEEAKQLLDGKLARYLDDPKQAKELANALKTAINSVYGLTSARFDNKLRDPRNKDNIVAKYGALFMINLKYEVQARGYKVVHIKTDSIKIANADKQIIQFCMDYAKEYGYEFEHEATYAKMCIVNQSTYIALYATSDQCSKAYGYSPKECFEHGMTWTATGDQFKVPYVFKTLFSKEQVEFKDMCETKAVSTALYLNMGTEEEPDYRFVGKVGSFCPVKPGCGGGILLRQEEDGYSAANGSKKAFKVQSGEVDYHYWLEAEQVQKVGGSEIIDRSYYDHLVDEAVEDISKYGDFERFASNDPDEDYSWLIPPPWE